MAALAVVLTILLTMAAISSTKGDIDPGDEAALLALRAGIPNFPTTCTRPILCDSQGRVTYIRLQDVGLSGTIAPEIGNLTELTQLWLAQGTLTGSLPTSICQLVKLEWLVLTANQLSGNIPECIGQLQVLEQLWLPGNKFTGSIPESINQIRTLQGMGLHDNRLTGTIPNLDQLTSLILLILSVNQLTGRIPSSIGQMQSLGSLWLSDNSLTGSIPSSIGFLPNLRDLFLRNNSLSGNIPTSFANSNLDPFDISSNYLGGAVVTSNGHPVCYELQQNCFESTEIPDCPIEGQRSGNECQQFCNATQTGGSCGGNGTCKISADGTMYTCECDGGYVNEENEYTCVLYTGPPLPPPPPSPSPPPSPPSPPPSPPHPPPSPPPPPPPPPPPSPPPPTSPTPICTLQHGWVITGNDITGYSGVNTSSAEACCALCNRVFGCGAFTFFLETKQCWLKTSVGTDVTPGEATTGFGGENLAFNKPTQLSSTFWDLDGIVDESFYGNDGSTWGRWFCTDPEPVNWWKVDLMGMYTVGKVELYNRICCLFDVPCSVCWWRMTGVQVYITNSSVSYDTNGSECNPEKYFDYNGGSYGFPFVKECNRIGRYVWVVLKTGQWLHLSEVRVLRKGGPTAITPTPVNITYEPFTKSSPIIFLNTAKFSRPWLRLTSELPMGHGQALHYSPIEILRVNAGGTCEGASFTTKFRFRVRNYGTTRGEGLAFVLLASNANLNAFGIGASETLGYTYDEIPKVGSYAVVFDTFSNVGEPLQPYIAFRERFSLNSVSAKIVPHLKKFNITMNAWVDYNGSSNVWKVYFSPSQQKPTNPLIKRTRSVCQILRPSNCSACRQVTSAYIGFTASTNTNKESYDVGDWSFASYWDM